MNVGYLAAAERETTRIDLGYSNMTLLVKIRARVFNDRPPNRPGERLREVLCSHPSMTPSTSFSYVSRESSSGT